jgi:hypothetical protein
MPSNVTYQKVSSVALEKIRVFLKDSPAVSANKRKEKRISDLPVGAVTLSFGSLNLRERKLSSLEGLETLPELKALYIQDNILKDLRYLSQPALELLQVERNDICNFAGCQRQPKLRSVHFEGNPVENCDLFSLACCISLNPELMKVNGQIVSKNEREMISVLDRPALQIALQQVLCCARENVLSFLRLHSDICAGLDAIYPKE